MIAHILYRVGTVLVFIASIMFLLALSWMGYGYETLVILVVAGTIQIVLFAALGVADTVERFKKGRHTK